jgi:hypothetical protein
MHWLGVLAGWAGGVAICLIAAPRDALALTPDSPEVQEAIERGVKFLESNAVRDDRLGAQALLGLTLLKNAREPDHPKVAEMIKSIQKALGDHDPDKLDITRWDIYSTGLSIVFLAQLDREKHREDIECLLKYLQKRQKPAGAWGYPSGASAATCDTSMTQYGVLCSWEATQAGYRVPPESIESAANWLLRTQDPSGGFGYQGNPGDGRELVAQSNVRPSMTAAGMGSLYICSNLLGLIEKKEKGPTLPSALREIKDKSKNQFKTQIDIRQVREIEARGLRWMQTNYKLDPPPEWVYYCLYALERCMGFRELFEQQFEKEPDWYTNGAEFLLKKQDAAGFWNGQCGVVPDTAFSVLFLMRSTQKSIKRAMSFGEGTMIGGRGIPKDTGDIEIRRGQIVSRSALTPAEQLLADLEKTEDRGGEDRNMAKVAGALGNLSVDDVATLTAKYGEKIRQLVDAPSPAARLAAVRALGKTRDFDNVETLIYALSDPDIAVVRAADESLLRIRRSTAASALTGDVIIEQERRALIEKWTAWYRAVRPGKEEK